MDIVVVYSDDQKLIRTLGSLAPVVAIGDAQWQWTADELGIRRMVPLVFDIDELQRAVRGCLAADQASEDHPGGTGQRAPFPAYGRGTVASDAD